MSYALSRVLRAITLPAILAAALAWPGSCAERTVYRAFLDADREQLTVLVVAEGPHDGTGSEEARPGRLLVFWGPESTCEDPGSWSADMAAHAVVSTRNEGPGQAFNLYIPTEVQFADLDDDGIAEIVSWWRSGPYDAYYAISLAVTKYDPRDDAFTTYAPHPEYQSSHHLVSELGGFYVDRLAGGTRIVRYAPVTRSDEPNGVECLLCKHRFRIEVLELGPRGLRLDPLWNRGEPLVTELKYYPYETGEAELGMYVRNPAFDAALDGDRAGVFLLTPPLSPVGLPLPILGEVSAEVGTLLVEIADADGVVLLLDSVRLSDKEPGGSASFDRDLYYSRPTTEGGDLRFIALDTETGDTRVIASFALVFAPVEDALVRVFFANPQLDALTEREFPGVYPVWRRIAKTDTPAEEALDQLLRGPTFVERNQGYATCLPSTNIRIYFAAEAGVADVLLFDTGWDRVERAWSFWDPSPEDDALGESQVRETLLQFAGTRQVIMHASWRPGVP